VHSATQPPVDVDSFYRIPSRVFLDTCVVNLILDFSEALFDGAAIPHDLRPQRRLDVEALCGIFETGARSDK
jgi:hypothetical protein